jgi:hypothetical protein
MDHFKRVLPLLILTTVTTLSDRATYDSTKTQFALPMDTPPTIDGVINTAEWERASGAAASSSWQVGFNANLEDQIRGGAIGDAGSPPTSAEDLAFLIYAGYDSQNLYIAVRVNDDVIMTDSAEPDSANGNTWMDDAIEIFIDGDNSNFETRDTSGTNSEVVGSGGQFVVTANNAYREAEAGNPGYGESNAWFAKTAARDDGTGYDAEFRFSLATIGNPKPGDIIGFTVGVNDDDDGEGAERQLIWVGTPHTEATYGNLLIGRRTYSAPKVAKAPTVDGVINADEYAGASEIKMEQHTAIHHTGAGDDTWEATDNGFSAWVIHDAEAIYVAVNAIDDQVVTDTTEAGSEDGSTWDDDSIELFFDADIDRELAKGTAPYEGQYVFTANGAWRDNEALNPTFGADQDWFAATSKTAQGFQVEFKVKKSALLSPADDATVGFHIAQNDDDGAGTKAHLGWNGAAHVEYSYGDLTLRAGGATGPPELGIAKSASTGITVGFTGTLQSAETVRGPYVDVPGAVSPLKVTPDGAARFYRSINK